MKKEIEKLPRTALYEDTTGRVFDRSDQRRRKREAVVRAAACAFNSRGFANTTMEDVSHALGVSKATLYQYYHSKQEILYECHLISISHGEAGLALAQSHSGPGIEKLLVFLRRYMQGAFGDLGSLSILTDVNSLAPKHRAEVVKRRAEISHATDALIAEGISDGTISRCDPKVAKLFVMGVVNWIPAWYRENGSGNPEGIMEGFLNLFRHGLEGNGKRFD